MLYGLLFEKQFETCGKKQNFLVSLISQNLYEAKADANVALLWKEGDQWKSSSNFICDETASVIGQEIELYLRKAS